MATIIRRGRVETAHWPLLDEARLRALAARDGGGRPDVDGPADGVLVPFQLWRAEPALCAALGVEVGVLLRDDDDPAEVAPELNRLGVIAVSFPRFTNGRGYSIGRLLRGRYGYRGELRAVGDIMRDQLFYLARVGFDAFELRPDQDPSICLSALHDFTEPYQASSDQPVPLFRRRVA